jgi:hypothetical protein
METGIDRNQIVGEVNRSAHGKLSEYSPIIGQACIVDPEFLAHLIAWDFTNGQIKDSKLALPVLTAAHREFPDELVENSLAHLALQPPRELLRALRFSFECKAPKRRQNRLEATVRSYLNAKESEPGKWFRLVARHRRSLKALYALTKCSMPDWASAILFKNQYVAGSMFADIAMLGKMQPDQAAAAIQKWHLSPLVVSGAMAGSKAQEASVVVQATMEQMSSTEVVTRAKGLEKKGVARDAALKETFRKKVAQATKSAKATLKTSVAADELEDDGLKTMLRELQERQIQAQKDAGRGIDGDWLVISDKSGSQALSIELGQAVAAAIAKFVSGRVFLAFCDIGVLGREVTGQSLERIKDDAKYIRANGGTSYGVGLQWASIQDLDGIAIVGDGAENHVPVFADVYAAYKQASHKEPPVYLYRTASTEGPLSCGAFKRFMDKTGAAFTEFDLTHRHVDYFALPNLVQTMSVNRFGLVDKIMACPLLTLEQVFKSSARVAA